jgi:CRISPR/Cas system-associated exonuclease Cas4 (RecB family)
MDTYKRIGISWLHNQAFCEYQLFLKWVLKAPNLESIEVIEGDKSHGTQRVTTNEKAAKSGILPIKDILTSVKESTIVGTKFYRTDFRVECDIMIGEIDEIFISKSKILIVDYKPLPRTGIPFLDDKRQTIAYAFCFHREYLNITTPIFCEIKDENTGNQIWLHEYTVADDADILDATYRSLDIVNQKREPIDTKNPNKCRGCRLNSECPRRKDI